MQDTLNNFYFPTAVALGALHALEPGHAKALTASYLIGIKGTKRDSLLLGLSVAATHSIVVIGISVAALLIGREAFAGEATHALELASGAIAVLIGVWMLQRRLRALRRQKAAARGGENPQEHRSHVGQASARSPSHNAKLDRTYHHNHDHAHAHAHHHDHDHHHDHNNADNCDTHQHQIPDYVLRGERPSFWQIMAFGAAGGLIPCPASITVMLLALSAGRLGFGLFTVVGFSLGLALALVGVGMLVVTGMSQLSGTSKLSWFSRQAPLISAVLVILSGVFALAIAVKG